jgi:hypothetical protein
LEEADAAKLTLEGLQRKEEALRGAAVPSPAPAPAPPPATDDAAEAPPPPSAAGAVAAAAGKSIMSGFSAFRKFAGKQFAKLSKPGEGE